MYNETRLLEVERSYQERLFKTAKPVVQQKIASRQPDSPIAKASKDLINEQASGTNAALTVRSPRMFQSLLWLFLDSQNFDTLLGDLEERYAIIRDKKGKKRAEQWFYAQVFTTTILLAWASAKRLLTFRRSKIRQ